jgi:hypothetical protein
LDLSGSGWSVVTDYRGDGEVPLGFVKGGNFFTS